MDTVCCYWIPTVQEPTNPHLTLTIIFLSDFYSFISNLFSLFLLHSFILIKVTFWFEFIWKTLLALENRNLLQMKRCISQTQKKVSANGNKKSHNFRKEKVSFWNRIFLRTRVLFAKQNKVIKNTIQNRHF